MHTWVIVGVCVYSVHAEDITGFTISRLASLENINDLPARALRKIVVITFLWRFYLFGGYSFSTNVVKTIINHPIFYGLYHLFMAIWGIVY